MPEKSKRHQDDYTALMNWATHNEVSDPEITQRVLKLADRGVRVREIEGAMKSGLRSLERHCDLLENLNDGEYPSS